MTKAKIITISIFLVLFNYVDGMIWRIQRYFPSKTIKQTKPYKKSLGKQSKKVFSPKKIDKKFYTTQQNSPEKGSFWQSVKNWIGRNWYGKEGETNFKSFENANQYQNKKKQKLYERHLNLLNSMDLIEAKEAKKIHKKLFDEMIKTVEHNGIALVSILPVQKLIEMQMDAATQGLDFKKNAKQLYELSTFELNWKEALFTIEQNGKVTSIIADLLDKYSNHNQEQNHRVIHEYLIKKMTKKYNLDFARFSPNEGPFLKKIYAIIEKYSDNYQEPVLLKLFGTQHLSIMGKIFTKAFRSKTFIVDKRTFSKDITLSTTVIKDYINTEKPVMRMETELFNVHNINFEKIFNEIDREIEELMKNYGFKKAQQEAEKNSSNRQKAFEEEFKKQQQNKQYQEYQQRYQQAQQSSTTAKTDALRELELPQNPMPTLDQVKAAYRKLAKINHPDNFQSIDEKNKAHEKMLRLRRALEELLGSLFGRKK